MGSAMAGCVHSSLNARESVFRSERVQWSTDRMIDDEITVCGRSIPFRLCNVSDRHNIDTGGISMKQITLKTAGGPAAT